MSTQLEVDIAATTCMKLTTMTLLIISLKNVTNFNDKKNQNKCLKKGCEATIVSKLF